MRAGNSPGSAVFFVLVVILASLLLRNLVVCAIVSEYQALSDASAWGSTATEQQVRWAKTMELALRARPRRTIAEPSWPRGPGWRWLVSSRRAILRSMLRGASGAFERGVMLVVLCNATVLATMHYQQSDAWTSAQSIANAVFVALFVAEMAARVWALGPSQFASLANGLYTWGWFDLSLCVLSVADATAAAFPSSAAGDGSLASNLSAFRVLRCLRLLRLLRSAGPVFVLCRALVLCIPHVLNVFALAALAIFMYAIVGRYTLSGIAHTPYVNSNANFDKVSTSVLTMLRCASGESWNGMLADILTFGAPPYCRGSACPSQPWAVFFFVSFVILVNLVLLNLLVAVIIERYMYISHWSRQDREGHLSREHIESFRAAWAAAKVRERREAEAKLEAERAISSSCRCRPSGCKCCVAIGLSCGRWWSSHVMERKQRTGGQGDEGGGGGEEEEEEEERIVVATNRATLNDYHLRLDLIDDVIRATHAPLGLSGLGGRDRSDLDDVAANIAHATVHFTEQNEDEVEGWDVAVNFYDLLSCLIESTGEPSASSSSSEPSASSSSLQNQSRSARALSLPPVALRRVDSMRKSQKKKGSRYRTTRRRASLKRGSSDDV